LLLGLLREHDGIAAQVLGEMSVPLEAVRYEVAERVGHWASAPKGSPPFTPRAKKVLDLSGHEAKQLGHS
jgi:ATP-dependent Clp protease ATP-binding subunit ClpC